MKIYHSLLLIIVAAMCIAGCDRISDVDSPHFNVTTDKDVYKVGDTIRFHFEGNPDIIAFYSGEMGYDYDHTSGRIAEPDYLINFESQSQNGAQTGQMRILVSKDFDEDYSIDGVHAATWTDITSKFTMAPPNNGSAYVGSGKGSFEELLDNDSDTTKLYFAVKQVVLNQTLNGAGNLNRLRYFTITSLYETLNTTLYEHANMGWKLFASANKQPDRASLENSYTIMMRNSWWTSPVNYYEFDTEDWAVSTAIRFPKQLDLGPDRAIGVKGVNDLSVDGYTYAYNVAGDYKVVFKAINANVEGSKEVVREFNIKIVN